MQQNINLLMPRVKNRLVSDREIMEFIKRKKLPVPTNPLSGRGPKRPKKRPRGVLNPRFKTRDSVNKPKRATGAKPGPPKRVTGVKPRPGATLAPEDPEADFKIYRNWKRGRDARKNGPQSTAVMQKPRGYDSWESGQAKKPGINKLIKRLHDHADVPHRVQQALKKHLK
jgi:hypothetical protein